MNTLHSMFIHSLKVAPVVMSLTKFAVPSEYWLKVGQSNSSFGGLAVACCL